MSREAKTRSQRSGVAVLAAIAAIAGAVQLAAPQPAAAAGRLELQRVAGTSGEPNDDTVKVAQAVCKPGQVVVGGGGAIWEQGPTSARLTGLTPGGVNFVAVAETRFHSGGPDWRVDAYAVCADSKAWGADLDKYQIVPGYSVKRGEPPRTDKFQTALATCPPGTVAYGSGASVPAVGQIGLQMNRTSGPLDIARATARAEEHYGKPWTLTSSAICAPPLGGVHSEGELDPGTSATHRCTGGDSIAGPGGGGGLVDGGPVWLKVLYPFSNSDVDVEMTGLFPDHQVLASPTCADRE